MKIVGGSFGLSGKALLADQTLQVRSDRRRDYVGSDVKTVSVSQQSEGKFGFIGALIGAVLFGYLASLVLGFLGWVIGVAFAIAGSFYKKKRCIADLEFTDGMKLTLTPNDYEAKRLIEFSDS